MNRYLMVVFNEETKTISYKIESVRSELSTNGDLAVLLINKLSKNERLINFWQLWRYGKKHIKQK